MSNGLTLPFDGKNGSPTIAALSIGNNAGGPAIVGTSSGVPFSLTPETNSIGVQGTGDSVGVLGKSASIGVVGNGNGTGVVGTCSGNGTGVVGTCSGTTGSRGIGVQGTSAQAEGAGVVGIATGTHGTFGVIGQSSSTEGGAGVSGESSSSAPGVSGTSASGPGVIGSSTGNKGVIGTTTTGVGVYGQSTGSGLAGQFDGNVKANGDIFAFGNLACTKDLTTEGNLQVWLNIMVAGTATVRGNLTVNELTASSTVTAYDVLLTGGQDCAEEFDLIDAEQVEPGSVVVIADDGRLRQSQMAYDRRVAGVVSGAGAYRPAIVLDGRASSEGRGAVALVGKVFCKVDADPAPILLGDLLTTSARPGFAMKATDPAKAFGAVIGKALRPLGTGQGTIPILVALQ